MTTRRTKKQQTAKEIDADMVALIHKLDAADYTVEKLVMLAIRRNIIHDLHLSDMRASLKTMEETS